VTGYVRVHMYTRLKIYSNIFVLQICLLTDFLHVTGFPHFLESPER